MQGMSGGGGKGMSGDGKAPVVPTTTKPAPPVPTAEPPSTGGMMQGMSGGGGTGMSGGGSGMSGDGMGKGTKGSKLKSSKDPPKSPKMAKKEMMGKSSVRNRYLKE
jgi:hypothetical protein